MGNMRAKDHKILQYVTKLSSRVIEVDQVPAAQLYDELIITKTSGFNTSSALEIQQKVRWQNFSQENPNYMIPQVICAYSNQTAK